MHTAGEYCRTMFVADTPKMAENLRIFSDEWKSHFWPRDVIALSANPLFVEPLKYIGEAGYVSDTEDSSVIAESKQDASTIQVSIISVT